MDTHASDPFNEQFVHTNNGHFKRKRTISSKKEHEGRCQTPEPREFIHPYEPLKFPLSDDVYNELAAMMSLNGYNTKNAKKIMQKTRTRFGRGRNGLRRYIHNKKIHKPFLDNTKNMGFKIIDDYDEIVEIDKKKIKEQLPVTSENTLPYINTNGNKIKDDEETEDEMETGRYGDISGEEDEYEDDLDDDDGFPRHPFAIEDPEDEDFVNDSVPGSELLISPMGILSDKEDMESSDYEPFQDDDPNDPEWNSSTRTERSDRQRRNKL